MFDANQMTPRACQLLGDILAHGGGLLDEHGICSRTGLSHGYFSAARAELIAAGLLRVERVGRQACYVPLVQSVPQVGGAKEQREPVEEASPSGEDHERVTGIFDSFDDWDDALSMAFGDVTVDEGGTVYLDDGTVQHYEIKETEDGLEII